MKTPQKTKITQIKQWNRIKLALPTTTIKIFFLMLFSALAFGLGSFNFFYRLKANINLVAEYGIMALMDGALKEFFILSLYGLVSLVAYIIFKCGEKTIVENLTKKS